jgi:hypothetical protein
MSDDMSSRDEPATKGCCSLQQSGRERFEIPVVLLVNYASAGLFVFGLDGLGKNAQTDFDAMLEATGITALAWVLTKNMVEAGFNACFSSKKEADGEHDPSVKTFFKQTAYDLVTLVILVFANIGWTQQLSGEVDFLKNATAPEKFTAQMTVLHAVFALKVVFFALHCGKCQPLDSWSPRNEARASIDRIAEFLSMVIINGLFIPLFAAAEVLIEGPVMATFAAMCVLIPLFTLGFPPFEGLLKKASTSCANQCQTRKRPYEYSPLMDDRRKGEDPAVRAC